MVVIAALLELCACKETAHVAHGPTEGQCYVVLFTPGWLDDRYQVAAGPFACPAVKP